MSIDQKIDQLSRSIVEALDRNVRATELVAARLKWLNDRILALTDGELPGDPGWTADAAADAASSPTGEAPAASSTSSKEA